MAIKASDVKKLREMTGAGMMDCKKALTEADGDFDKAVEYLRKKGQKISEKRADREASEGSIFVAVSEDRSKAAMIELNCETDFVARNEDFTNLGQQIAEKALQEQPADLEALKQLKLGERTIAQELTDAMGRIGEKVEVSKYEKMEADAIVSYLHIGGRVGVLVGFSGIDGVDVDEAGKDVAMQIAAMNPMALDKDHVPEDVLKREKEIALEQTRNDPKNAKKPEEILEKIVMGRVNKFFKENTLLNQEFVKDPSLSVEKYLASKGKDLKVTAYKRMHLGG